MIYLRTFAIAIILIVLSFFSWRCNQDEPVTNNIINNQNDAPCDDDEYLLFEVQEYVKVTPFEDMPPYYEYRSLWNTECCDCFDTGCNCGTGGGICFHCSTFTTPSSSRFEGGNLIETQHFKYIGEAYWTQTRGGYTLLWSLYNGTTYYYIYDTEPFDTRYFFSYNATGSLPQNTSITAKYGKDVAVD